MKKSLKITVTAILAVLMILSVLPFTTLAANIYAAKSITVYRGRTVDLNSLAYYGDAVFTSENKAVATVSSSGVVTAVKNGSAIVTITGKVTGSRLGTYSIRVIDRVSVYGISIGSVEQVYSAAKNTIKLTATIRPDDASIKDVKWSILAGGSIATISDTGVLKTNGTGAIYVRCTSADNTSVSADIIIYVGGATPEKPYVSIPGYPAPGYPYYPGYGYIPAHTHTDACDKGTCQYCNYYKLYYPTYTNPGLNWNSNGYYYDADGKLVILPYVWVDGKYVNVTESSLNKYHNYINWNGTTPYIFYTNNLTNIPCKNWTGTDYYNWNCIYNSGKWMTPSEILKAHPKLSFIIDKDANGDVYIIGTVGELLSSHSICAKCGKCKTCGECTCKTPTISVPSVGTGVLIPHYTFGDVTSTDWYYNSILYVTNNGYIAATNSNSFGVYDVFTRAEMIEALGKAAGVNTAMYMNTKYSIEDVKKSDSVYPYAQWAVDKGLITLEAGNKAKLDTIVTRGEFAQAAYACALSIGKNTSKTASIASYYDYKDVPSAYRTAMAWAVQNKLIPMLYPSLNANGYISKVYLASALYFFD